MVILFFIQVGKGVAKGTLSKLDCSQQLKIERGKMMNIYGCKRDKMVTWLNTKVMFGKSRV
jgi:hypothetical protein